MNLLRNHFKKIILIPLAVVVLSLSIAFLFNSYNQTSIVTIKYEAKDSVISKPEIIAEAPLPSRLRIPKISVDSAIDYVGLTTDGRVDVPKGPDTVAWFNLGPRPGERGSSIIDGHSGYKNGKKGVFDNLNELSKGDKLYVENSKGEIFTFVVREFKHFSPKSEAKVVFNSGDDQSHLNLITCTGAWNDAERTHSDRLVVFTDREL